MNEDQINFLINIGHVNQGNVGFNALNWANYVFDNLLEHLPAILDQQFNRNALFAYCNNVETSNLHASIAILAWGGMRRDHGIRLFDNWENLEPIINDIRLGNYATRIDAFEAFQNARIDGHLPGLGIGYFTKLICFLHPLQNGYIMDQWTGKSINLLNGAPVIHINQYGWVTDHNDSATYGAFCDYIEQLAGILGCTGMEAEQRIFSVGRGQGLWRNYLRENYPANGFN